VEQKVFVGAAKPGYKMVFKCGNGMFSCIVAMDIWLHQLKINVCHCKEILEDGGHFIIQVLKVWSQAGLTEACTEHLESHQEGASVAVLEQFCQNGIAVMVIEDHNVVVAGAGWGWNFPSLVCVDLAKRLDDGGKTGMQLLAIGDSLRITIGYEFGLISFGQALVLLALVQVALVHCH